MAQFNVLGLKRQLVHNNNESSPKVGQLIEIFDNTGSYMIWSIAQIIDIKNDQIKTTYYGWDGSFDEWIHKNNKKRLAPLQTHTFPMELLSKPPCMHHSYQPSIYNSCIIIKNNKYDIKMKTWSKLTAKCDHKVCAIDYANNRMFYVYNTKLHTLNLNTNESDMQIDKIPTDIGLRIYPDACEIIENKLHIITDMHIHFVYDINSKRWTKLAAPTYSHKPILCTVVKIIYIKSKQIFITFINSGTWFSNKFTTYYCENNNSNYWVKYEELSLNTMVIQDVINILDHLLVFKVRKSKIMFFDLLTSKWFKCDKILPISDHNHHKSLMVNTMNNYVHFVSASDNGFAKRSNYKIHLMDMIPLQLYNLYRDNKYNKLIFGYIKQMENNNNLSSNFPFYLNKLMLKFYPCF
eukprot:477745_1